MNKFFANTVNAEHSLQIPLPQSTRERRLASAAFLNFSFKTHAEIIDLQCIHANVFEGRSRPSELPNERKHLDPRDSLFVGPILGRVGRPTIRDTGSSR